MNTKPIVVVTGQPISLPLQCWYRGGVLPSVFNSTDILTAAVLQSRQTVILFSPTIGWYTANSTQAGYTQGQVEAAFSTTQMLILVPTISYTLAVWRALVGVPSVKELIVRAPLIVESLAV